MKEEFITSFLKSGREILSQVGNINIGFEATYIKKEVKLQDDIGIVIGMTGGIRGQVILTFGETLGKQLASNMMSGVPVAVLDNMSKNTLAQLGNIIIGNAISNFYNMGISVDITPPSILMGKNMIYSSPSSKIICIPFKIRHDIIEMNLVTEENKEKEVT